MNILIVILAGFLLSIAAVIDCVYQCSRSEHECFNSGGHIKHYSCVKDNE